MNKFTLAEQQEFKFIESIKCRTCGKSVLITFPRNGGVRHTIPCCNPFDNKIESLIGKMIKEIFNARSVHNQ